MQRYLLKNLQAWLAKKDRKPLILMGVRQTGKTYLLKQFGAQNFAHCHYINFEEQPSACALFAGDLDPKELLNQLAFYLRTPIDIHQDLVVFDEIQACPRALTSLKYFCEQLPELALCSAGSLLGLALNEGSYPVGKVDMLHLYPLTFSEFLAGVGDQHAVDYLWQLDLNSSIPEAVHQQLWRRLKHYFVTGGLPEVVALFAEHQADLYAATSRVRQKQKELIYAYYADIAKHSGKVNAMHIDRTWRAVPMQLSSTHDGETNRFKFKGIIPGISRYQQLVNVIDWLESAELVIKLPLVDTVKQPLPAFAKANFFKLFMFDIGILGAMSELDPKIIYDYGYGSYQGYFAENFVAQQLLATYQQTLFTWQENRSEIEFLLQWEGQVIPIEVKSGSITRAKSLEKYIELYQPPRSFILSAKPLQSQAQPMKTYLPLYLSERLLDI